jgi:hypothetical protein
MYSSRQLFAGEQTGEKIVRPPKRWKDRRGDQRVACGGA